MNIICKVISNEKLTKAHEIYAMTLDAPNVAKSAQCGQFIHVKCEGFTLRRPISIADIQAESGQLKICYEVRGEGTAWLAGRKTGDTVDIIGPLGRGFDLSEVPNDSEILLVGGGIGIYPLYSVAKAFGSRTHTALGFRNESVVNFEREFRDTGCNVSIATDDGSYGQKGYVTDIVREILDSDTTGKIKLILTCGPKAMMRGVYEIAKERGIACQVSLEERMACGVGACLVCVCKINGAYERVCVYGPVVDGSEVDWE